jgi:hypothetical protein
MAAPAGEKGGGLFGVAQRVGCGTANAKKRARALLHVPALQGYRRLR